MKNKVILTAISAMLLAGCAGPSYQPPSSQEKNFTQSYNADFDKVWEATVDWFAINNIPIKNIEKDSGIIGSDYSLGSSYTQVDCGVISPGDMHVMYDQTVVANINVLVRETSSGANVQPNVFGNGTFMIRDVLNNIPKTMRADRCVSTGELENSLHRHLSSSI
ncbi:unnamed protein product [Ectocarpus sp. 12 AP-2014]